MEQEIWCQMCEGGGSDIRPPYTGICWVCRGTGSLKPGEYEQIIDKEKVWDILQSNAERAMDFRYEADHMVVVTRDNQLQKDCLKDKAAFLEDIVEKWFRDLAAGDTKYALQYLSEYGPVLEDAWVSAFESSLVDN